jgi:hypothetical protein
MEIDFNPGRLPKLNVDATQPVTRREAPPAVSATAPPFQMTAALESKLQAIPLVRPEVVQRAVTLLGDVKYPPDEVLQGISVLLAINLSQNK